MSHIDTEHKRLPPSLVMPRPRAGSDGPVPGVPIQELVTRPATAPVAPPRWPHSSARAPLPLGLTKVCEIDLRGAGIFFVETQIICERPLQYSLTLFEVPNK
jgi:hypothetical protein